MPHGSDAPRKAAPPKTAPPKTAPHRILSVATAAGLFLSGVATAAMGFDPDAPIALPGWQMEFENINPMVRMATAWGDRAQGAHGTFGTFPPNFQTPFHTHSVAYHGVVIKGVMRNPFDGEDESPTLEPGSYWYVPASAVHATACVSDIPCEFYFTAADAFDFVMAE